MRCRAALLLLLIGCGSSPDATPTGTNTNPGGSASPEATWVSSVASPFTSDTPGSGFDDLTEIGVIAGSARVVGFGEATHGTREFFRMKHRAFEYLVEKQGFTHFAIEATMPEARALDRYVTRGDGDPAALLARLYFWTWNTQEVLDLIRWMRDYNVRAGAPTLRFHGFDMQSPHQSIDSVTAILSRVDTALSTRARTALSCLAPGSDGRGQYNATTYYNATNPGTRGVCEDAISGLQTAVALARPGWAGRMSVEDLNWLEQYVALVHQWHQLASVTGSVAQTVRDRSMADNIVWLTTQHPSDRFFAWAHNLHVARRAGSMGESLNQQLGQNYRAIGFTFGTGQFNAVNVTPTGQYTTLQVHAINTIDESTLESIFAATTKPRLILDLRRIQSGGDAASNLGRAILMRSIGAVYSSQIAREFYFQTTLPASYDGMIWFAVTTPSMLLPF